MADKKNTPPTNCIIRNNIAPDIRFAPTGVTVTSNKNAQGVAVP